MRQPRASSEGRARPGEGAREAPRGWPDPLAQADACSPPAFTPLPFLLLPGALGCAHRPAEATGGMSPRKGGASQDSGCAPPSCRPVTEAWGGGPPGCPPPVPPAHAPQGGPPPRPRPSESWPRTRPLCLGSRRVCEAHRTRKITESLDPPPPSPASASPPRAPVHHLPKDPFVRQQSPRSTQGCPPIHPRPLSPESFSDNRARLKVQATTSQC